MDKLRSDLRHRSDEIFREYEILRDAEREIMYLRSMLQCVYPETNIKLMCGMSKERAKRYAYQFDNLTLIWGDGTVVEPL